MSTVPTMEARSVLEVDLGAVAHNVGVLRTCADGALVCAVVKADGYGHGAVAVSRTALAAGADWLAVSQVGEARELRRAGIEAPLLVLSEPLPVELDELVELRCRVVVYRVSTVEALDEAATRLGAPAVPVHVKVDTGMNRVGCHPVDALGVVRAAADARAVEFEGLLTHLAVADEPANEATTQQLEGFARVEEAVRAAGFVPQIVHIANSAACIGVRTARRDLVRCGISVYGVAPAPGLGADLGLRPAMAFRSQVTWVKDVAAGSAVSYGLRHTFDAPTRVATVPVGYADGVPRSLGLAQAEVLIRGRRHRMVGVVTMDQLMVDVGEDSAVEVGDEVVLLGAQGTESVTAEEWAGLSGTVGYEIVCAVGRRAERVWVGAP